MTAADLEQELQAHASAYDAEFLQRFFKTGPGQYGEGDTFIGVRVPQTRKVCKDFKDLPLPEVQKLLDSEIHEYRLAGLIILVQQFKKADEVQRQRLHEFYLQAVYAGRVNNWDLVDTSAEYLVGEYLYDKPRGIIFELAVSDNLWQRRVAVLATFGFIKKGDPSTTLELAEKLLNDPHDLIQKAAGWMLREVGKRCDESLLIDFLDQHAADMPRTMLRYSIERLSSAQRQYYMHRRER